MLSEGRCLGGTHTGPRGSMRLQEKFLRVRGRIHGVEKTLIIDMTRERSFSEFSLSFSIFNNFDFHIKSPILI